MNSKKNKGFTLLETIIVVAVLATIALAGMETITEFQKNALLEATANEFASALRTARSKSLAGELPEGNHPDEFAEGGLPQYGVEVNTNQYFLFRDYQLEGEGPNHEALENENYSISDRLALTPSGMVTFNRVTGLTNPTIFTLSRLDGRGTREIEVDQKGVTFKK